MSDKNQVQQVNKLVSKSLAAKFVLFFVIYEITTYLSNDMIMPAMLQVVKQYQASVSNVAYSLTYYIIGGSSLQIFLGQLSEKFGKKKVILTGNIIFLLATLAIVCARSIDQFLLGRLLQGTGLCFIFIGYAMVHELFDDVNAVKVTTLMANIVVFAPLIGPVIGAMIIQVSNWQSIFIISAILGLIALCGLYCYMPGYKTINTGNNQNSSLNVYRRYIKIISNKTFMFGIFTCGVLLVPTIAWIGLAPTMIMHALQQSFTRYISYQCFIFSGFIISSLLIQKIAGKFSFKSILYCGAALVLTGAIFSAIFHHIEDLIIFGMSIYTLGEGLCYGIIIRTALMSTKESTNLSSAVMSLLNCIYLVIGLSLSNIICGYFAYRISIYALAIVFPMGIIVFSCIMRYARSLPTETATELKAV